MKRITTNARRYFASILVAALFLPCSLMAQTVSVTATNVTCYGAADGTVTADVTGGTAPYAYIWTTGETTSTISGLSPGMYGVTATDAMGAVSSASVTITQPSVLLPNATATGVSSSNGTDGTASANPSGGTPPYTFLWSTGITSESISGLSPGAYTVGVFDANGCQTNQTVVVQNFGCNVTVNVTFTNDLQCFGAADGSLIAQGGNGITPYEFFWSSGSTTPMSSGLSAGIYTVTVSDESGCTAVTMGVVGQPDEIVVGISSTDVLCNGGNTGTASAITSGGVGGYNYVWSNGGTSSNTGGLPAGTHDVTVTDANGCMQTATFTINEPPPLVVDNIASTDVLCNGESNGTASANVSGGVPPYSYAWDNGATTADITGLSAGIYLLTVTDANGCPTNGSVTINEPPPLEMTIGTVDVSCNGASDGTATAFPTGGTTPYSYMWSNGGTTATITGLPAGDYTATVTDTNGCTVESVTTVNEPEPLDATAAVTDALCNGAADGTATILATGGTTPYSYEWSNGGTTAGLTGLSAGDYIVTVTDANGCTIESTVTINEPALLEATTTQMDVLCNGAATGSAAVFPTGGTAPYSYQWSSGGNDIDTGNLTAGGHTVTVTDANGCALEMMVTITEPDALVVDASATDALCNGDASGTAMVTATGGVGAYSYQWTDGEITDAVMDLLAGDYMVTVSDENGCTAEATTTVAEPDALVVSASSVTNETDGDASGAISINVSGGTMPYSYEWSNASTDMDISGLPAGDYTVTVTDANGCMMVSDAITVDNVVDVLDVSLGVYLSLFPNPAQGALNIRWENPSATDALVTLTNINGQTLIRQAIPAGDSRLDISALPDGLYLLRLQTGNAFITRKVMVGN